MLIRIQKFLSDSGICSRRKAEEYIKEGFIKVNDNVVTELGSKIDTDKDKVMLKNKLIKKQNYVYFLLNKPIGYVSSFNDPGKRKDLSSLVKIKEHLGYAGRLDEDSEGLMLLTNDGDLIFKLTHPKFEHEKEYIIETEESISLDTIKNLKPGVNLDGYTTNPIKIVRVGYNKLGIILNEGKKRQIRRMLQMFGIHIKNLKRVRIGNLELGNLKSGQMRKLTDKEIILLKKSI